MAQRRVPSGEVIRAVWAGEDAFRGGRRYLHSRALAGGGEIYLTRGWKHHSHHVLTVTRDAGDDVYAFADADAAWRAVLGWDGQGKPNGYSHHWRRP